METVLITGANGLIGQSLTPLLIAQGYRVIHLVRRKHHSKVEERLWDPEKKFLEPDTFEDVDHMIHLAGENIAASRWTKKQKKKLYDSRIETTNLLFERSAGSPLKSFICASGISIYGTITTDKIFKEEDAAGSDFLASLSVDWEKAADQFSSRQIRVVKIRTSVVLIAEGGALDKMVSPIRKNVGAVLGSGKQYFPWIHLNDLCQIYLQSLQSNVWKGSYNAVAPEHVTNKELTHAIAKHLGKKIWLPSVPAFILKLVLGEMATLILEGSRASCDKLLQMGFQFQYPDLETALTTCLKLERN